MKKKPQILKQKNKARATQYGLFVSEFVSVATPYGVLAAVNSEEWFVTNPEGWKLGLGGSIAVFLIGLATLLISKQKENKALTGGWVTLIFLWYAICGVFFLLAQIMTQFYMIMFYTGFGLMGAFGLDLGSKHFKKKAEENTNYAIELLENSND